MVDRQGLWAASAPPPGYLPPPDRPLVSSPPRPVYREPHPIRAGAVLSGLAAGAAWLMLFGSLGSGLASYTWWTVGAAVSAWVAAVVLALVGDRGVAVGVSVAAGLGLSIATVFVVLRWAGTYDWPLW
ncbi:hypothetical protein [Actinoplanes sp. DH11]|uniref:hypothetical protein n=1 Tax=Actinoplanes sp. DH11 TaxID=2857011 RepID=UPI001E579D14|nr:hypothetical protein [Actinoplanes sp. DH11]